MSPKQRSPEAAFGRAPVSPALLRAHYGLPPGPNVAALATVALLALILASGSAYVLLLLDPVASGSTQYADCVQWQMHDGCGLQLWDSLTYMKTSEDLGIANVVTRFLDTITNLKASVFTMNNLGLYLQGALAYHLTPWAPQLFIFGMNFLLLVLAVRHLLHLGDNLGLNVSARAIPLILLNPLTTYYALSLTKEIWGIFFIAAFARYCSESRYGTVLGLALVSVAFRSFYLPVALGFIAVRVLRAKMIWYLLAASLLLGLLARVDLDVIRNLQAIRLYRATELGAQTGQLMAALANVQAYPFGHLIAAPIVALVSTVSPMLNPRAYENILDIGWFGNITSSYLMAFVAAAGIARYLRTRPMNMAPVGRYIGLFLILITMYPISYHRYLIPIYPLLCVWAFGIAPGQPRGSFAAHDVIRTSPTTCASS